jgi:predicted nucleic acid-binding protein
MEGRTKLMNEYKVFVDTWGWLALGRRKEPRHKDVKALYKEFREQKKLIFTSDYVLDELITLIFRREPYHLSVKFVEGIFKAIRLNQVLMKPITSEVITNAWELRKKFKDKPLISFTDLTSMSIMQQSGISQIITNDQHFIQVGMGFTILSY